MASLPSVSPDFTVYVVMPDATSTTVPPPDAGAAAVAGAGMLIFFPIWSFAGSTFGFAALSAVTETWNFGAMLENVSPLWIVYSLAVATERVGGTGSTYGGGC